MKRLLLLIVLALSPALPQVAAGQVRFGVGRDGACRVVSGGAVECWGAEGTWLGTLGRADAVVGPGGASRPAPVTGVSSHTALAVGGDTACVIQGPVRQVKCWGVRLPHSDDANTRLDAGGAVPVDIGVAGARSIVITQDAGCAVVDRGRVRCWGTVPGFGTLKRTRMIPRLANVREVALASGHACARTVRGAVYCWGYNRYQAVSPSSRLNLFSPVRVEGVTGATGLAVHERGSCALVQGGSLWCWGRGGPTPSMRPVRVPQPPLSSLAMGGQRTCVVRRDERLRCWGSRERKALGISTGTEVEGPDTRIEIFPKFAIEPVAPMANRPVAHVWAGSNATCAQTRDGKRWCWGNPNIATPLLPATATWPQDQYGRPADTSKPRQVG